MCKIKVGAIIVAAGLSRRMGGQDKIFARLGKESLIAHVIDVFQGCSAVDRMVVALSEANIERGRKLAEKHGWSKVTEICTGGERRQDSVKNGLATLGRCEWVIVHDGARPLVTPDIIERGLAAALETGAAVAAVPVTDTIKVVDNKLTVVNTLERGHLWSVQTPQIFRIDIINEAHRQIDKDATDDASLVEAAGYPVKIFLGANDNIKITTDNDIELAKILMRKRAA